MLDDILERENTFLDNKNNRFMKSKNGCFLFFLTWVWLKIGNFSIFLFLPKHDMKMCLMIL